jgi:tetratricopeptide (TPR) repeat protein
LDAVYWERINRKDEAYSVHKLGAFGSNLAALAQLFEQVWERPSPNMTEAGQALVLSWAGFGLRGLGRLREAAEPMRASLELAKSQNNWKNAAIAASNLSELHLTLGAVQEAVAYAQQAVEYADRSGDGFQKEASRTTLADALHQSGEREAAQPWFEEAEAMQRESQPGYRFLYSLRGFQYCDLLLSLGKWAEVLERAETTLKWATAQNWLLDIALDQLSIARAPAQAYETEPSDAHREAAAQYLNLAVEGLRKAGEMDMLPKGLLARADWHLHSQRPAEAAQDLEEVRDIAESGSMGLYLVEYHIAMARLRRLEGQPEQSAQHRAEALRRIEETGYRRAERLLD